MPFLLFVFLTFMEEELKNFYILKSKSRGNGESLKYELIVEAVYVTRAT